LKGKLKDFLLETLYGAGMTAVPPPNWFSLPPLGLVVLKPARNVWLGCSSLWSLQNWVRSEYLNL